MPQFRPPPPCMGQNKPKTKIVIRAGGGGYGPVGLREREESNLPNYVADFVEKQFVDPPKKIIN